MSESNEEMKKLLHKYRGDAIRTALVRAKCVYLDRLKFWKQPFWGRFHELFLDTDRMRVKKINLKRFIEQVDTTLLQVNEAQTAVNEEKIEAVKLSHQHQRDEKSMARLRTIAIEHINQLRECLKHLELYRDSQKTKGGHYHQISNLCKRVRSQL